MKKLIAILILTATWSVAETIFVSQTALGTGDGTNANNTRSLAWFHTSTNWRTDSGIDMKIGPGDTIRFIGSISGTVTVMGDGLEGEPIRLQFQIPATVNPGSYSHIVIE